ncbi:hypothetical protein CYMTET_41375 [Cymbomonas tetramitiformis]|uniref:Tubby C-terminal domain-containing protein n=1 Tax=Cymbomonas tetramitiformis TaxID=36881 RepID=A0AAE0F222_9CHLO|nr:hypothetical protein CYMTET_41375 [Cymbomonas tetramitiformis]
MKSDKSDKSNSRQTRGLNPSDVDTDDFMSVTGTDFTLPQGGLSASANAPGRVCPGMEAPATQVQNPGLPPSSEFDGDLSPRAGESVLSEGPPMSISSTALLHQNVIDFEFDSSDEEDEGYEMPTVEDAWKESAGSVPPGSQGESFSEQGAQSYLLPDVDSYRPAGDDDGVSIDANSAVAMSQFGSQAVGASQLESQVAGPTTSAGPNTGRGQNLAARVLNKVKTKSEIQEKPEKTGSNKSRVSSMSAAERFRMAQLAVKASLSASKMIVSLDEMRALPVPASVGSVKGYIVVDVAKSSQYPTYKYFLQEETAQDRFLLAAKRDRIADIRQHRYTFSIDPTDVSRTSGGYYGKLVANFTGTKYTLLDRGPKAGPGVTLETERRVLGACVYEPTVSYASGGYRRMTALLPNSYKGKDENGNPILEKWDEMQV